MNRAEKKSGFTLVELLVVIAIVALLIALLLPFLLKARQSARTVACAANVRSIVMAMQIYASENRGAIPGGPLTTGAFLYSNRSTEFENFIPDPKYSEGNCPDIIQNFDWASPLAGILGIKLEYGPSLAQRKKRFQQVREAPPFHCPENNLIAYPYLNDNNPSFEPGPFNSYATAMGFHLPYDVKWASPGYQGAYRTILAWNSPRGYFPRLSKVGDLSKKIFIADGGRGFTTSLPDGNLIRPYMSMSYLDYRNGWGPFSDVGPAVLGTRSWPRLLVPGNGWTSIGLKDQRWVAYRHGRTGIGGPADTYRFNVGFFDGHVETMGDLEGANPALWYPKGSSFFADCGRGHDSTTRDIFARAFSSSL